MSKSVLSAQGREVGSPLSSPPSSRQTRRSAPRRLFRAGLAITLGAGVLVAAPAVASATVDPASQLVINEVYGGGGNANAIYTNDFVELYNRGPAAVDLSTYSLQYASAAATTWGGRTTLTGSIAAGEYYLIQLASQAAVGAPLPGTPRHSATGINLSGTNGNVALVSSVDALTCTKAACAADPLVVDIIGFGSGEAASGTAAASPSNATSLARNATSVNTANNSADFVVGAPTPGAVNAVVEPPDPGDPVVATIPEIQGTPATQGAGAASPLVNALVTTSGVVTAAYPTGGFFGYTLQVPGSGDAADPSGASQAVFVYQPATTPATAIPVTIGQTVQVTGTVKEFNNLTEIEVAAADVVVLPDAEPVTPLVTSWPADAVGREALESMLVEPDDNFTITNTFGTNQYGEVGLAVGDIPLLQPTDVYPAGSAEADQVAIDNAGRAITLDDGSSTNFLPTSNFTPPYISLDDPVRVGAAVSFNEPLIVDYRNNTWKLQPTTAVTDTTAGEIVNFENTRTDAPSQAALGGDLKVASFNVLNYFTTLGISTAGCSAFVDRVGDGVTVDSCPGNGPRGAWDAADLQRQQDKIVSAINELDASVVGLMEIENSAVVDGVPDEAVGTLVAALNTAAGEDRWAFVPSSTELPGVAEMDVISNAIIYQPALLTPVGASKALGTESAAGGAFDNAREPIGQAFVPAAGGRPFFFAVNHFKSKSTSGAPAAPNPNANGQQGAWNGDRVAQATALTTWITDTVLPTYAADIDPVADVFLVGDFNSYTQEDPMQVLYGAGYGNLAPGDQYSYSFSGLSGSLDHVVANQSALERVQGAQVWNINAPESVALEYSRYNYQGTLFYDDSPFRSSDHDPVVAGFNVGEPRAVVDVNLLNINDFHGRIDANTVKFAGTVEQLTAEEGSANTLFLSAGDNIGASLFASSSAQDQPTIDVLNALGLDASAVGNHEFDQGFDDLVDRVINGGANAQWDYLGANVYLTGTTTPALPEYALFEVNGITVAVIGAVTQETPTLVSPSGISGLDFGDPVAAVNRVAAQLSDGDSANGEADVIVAEYHEGAGSGAPNGSTLEAEVALTGTAFSRIVTETSAQVDAIFNGHTHKQYAWDAPVPGVPGKTRPVLQTGSYGEFIGQIVLTVDEQTGEVIAYTQRNVARTTVADTDLIQTYPAVAEVNTIVQAALAAAAVIGNEPVGSVTADITTAYLGGSYINGVYVGSGPLQSTGRDDRASESALGNLVANSLVDSLSDPDRGGATIGVVNPGGLRNELYFDQDGVITYAEANAVLPFVNNLSTVSLTGAQFVTLLEQQWQTLPNGSIPARPYLQLGLSDNVSYTFDPAAALGAHITSVTVDGAPLDPAASYRIGTFSFLVEGGDNFRVFNDATDVRDSGLIDRDAWIQYLRDNPNLAPDFARHSVGVAGVQPNPTAGQTFTFTVSGLDMTSLGAPANTEISVALASGEGAPLRTLAFSMAPVDAGLGTSPVSGGGATVSVVLPASASGLHRIIVTASPSGTVVTLPLLDILAAPSTTDPTGTDPSSTSASTSPTGGGTTPTVPGGKGNLSSTGVSASLMPLATYAVLLLLIGAAFLIGARDSRAARGRSRGEHH